MKKFAFIALGLLAGALAFGAAENVIDKAAQYRPSWFVKGFYVGSATANPTQSTTNKITGSWGGMLTQEFPDAGTDCVTSASLTVTGANVNDTCSVSNPRGVAASVTCYVSAANTVKIRYCPGAGTDWVLDAGYTVRGFSNQ